MITIEKNEIRAKRIIRSACAGVNIPVIIQNKTAWVRVRYRR